MKKKRKRKLNKLALGGALILGALFITLSTHSPALFAERAGRAWLQSNNPASILPFFVGIRLENELEM